MVPSKEGEEVEGNSERGDGETIADGFLLLRKDELGFWDPLSIVLVGESGAGEASDVRKLVVGGGKGEVAMEVSKLFSSWRGREEVGRNDDRGKFEG
jgi:hypothetical protein